MEGVKSPVECWAEFGDLLSAQVICHGDDVILNTGTEHVIVFSGQERRVKTVLQFDSPVTSLALSADQSSLYTVCENTDLYCTALSPEPSSFPAEQSDEPVTSVVSRDSVLVKDDNVLSFTVAEDVLITISQQESVWTFHLRELPRSSARSTVFLRNARLQVPAITGVSRSDVDLAARISSPPVLTCIYPNSSPKGLASKHPRLDPHLFCLLFGVDASLLNSPVILCGLPDGRLVFFPLLLPGLTSSKGEQKTPIRFCYSLEQPVSFIGTSVVGGEGPQCVIVVGQRGRILLIRVDQRASDGNAAGCRFIEHIVQGPVVCACVDAEHLYYSTATYLLCLTLSKTLTSSSITAGLKEDRTRPESVVCLNVCRVIALTEPYISPAGSVQLLAVTLSGRLLHVTLPQDLEKANVSRLASSQAGQKIKDLLAGIGNVWERATIEKRQLELKNNTLKRLNQVLYICRLLLTCQKNCQDVSDHQQPISCKGAVKWITLLKKDSLVLSCILENQSSCALDQGWTLCLQVQSSLSVSAEGSSRTYSFALIKLDCGQKAEVTVPLESDGDLFLPVQVRCSLVYTLQSLLNPEEYRQLLLNDASLSQLLTHTGCICLALNTLTLDWLDALRIGELTQNGDHMPKQMSTWEATRMFLSSRQAHKEELTMPKAGPHTVAVHISSELLRNRLGLHDCSSALLCISALKWLLCRTANTEGQDIVQSPVVCAEGPNRQPVRLLTKEVILSDLCSEGPLSVVEIQVESVSMSAVCGLHHAILLRVQALLKDASVKPGKSVEIRRQRLCETVRDMEHLYKEVQDFRDPADGGTRRTSESLFHFYLQLREKLLVIL